MLDLGLAEETNMSMGAKNESIEASTNVEQGQMSMRMSMSMSMRVAGTEANKCGVHAFAARQGGIAIPLTPSSGGEDLNPSEGSRGSARP